MDQQKVKQLILQSKHGDIQSFRELVETHQHFAYAVAFRLLCSSYEAEEIVQEAFIKVWRHLDKFNSEMRFTTWLYKIVVNLCYDSMKTSRAHSEKLKINIDDSLILNFPSSVNIEAEIINKEQAQIIRFISEGLTPKQRLVFTLSEIQEFTAEEISTITGLTPAKIKSNLYYARQNIKEKLSTIEKLNGTYAI